LTNFHAQEFVSFCRDQEISQVKVLEFNKIKGEAKIYCIYSNNDLNSKLSLNYYDQNWKVITKKTLNVEGEIYWPVYLMQ
jgi:predicted acetyltransferase